MASHLPSRIAAAAQPLPPITDPSFGSHFDDLKDYQFVLLGDASHGTSEFYSARAEITKCLIQEHGFSAVTFEADWPDVEVIDHYIRQRPALDVKMSLDTPSHQPEPFKRFPTWMWNNREFHDLVDWMAKHNAPLPPTKRVGFYGLDLYSMGASIRAVIDYLEHVDPEAANDARARYGCLQPWIAEPSAYGLSALGGGCNCEKHVVRMLHDLLAKRIEYMAHFADGEEFHSSVQNAYLVKDAEQYYRAMFFGSASSWSVRDTHMLNTLKRLLDTKPSGAKVIIWAHNSHCGDARYTHMGPRGQLNLGQLVRENFGRQNVAIVGCDTHKGTVAAAHEWDANMEIMRVKPSRLDSWERLAHETGMERFVLDLRPEVATPFLRSILAAEQRLMRFIGVIYRPKTEKMSHYSETQLQDQFDKYVWFDSTRAVESPDRVQPWTRLIEAETYPFGL